MGNREGKKVGKGEIERERKWDREKQRRTESREKRSS